MATSRELGLPDQGILYTDSVDLTKPANAERVPQVSGNVVERAKDTVKWAYKRAKSNITRYLFSRALGPYVRALKDVDVSIERMDPDGGLTGAYTNGRKIGVNEYIVPETNVFSRFMERLYEKKDSNPLARYLYGKLSKAYENLTDTLEHEMIHVYQINSGIVDKILNETEKVIDERVRLPEHLKPYKKFLVYQLIVPQIEGLTEATRLEAKGCATPKDIKFALSGDPTTYADYARISVDASGGKMPSDVQRSGKLGRYVRNFLNMTLSPTYA